MSIIYDALKKAENTIHGNLKNAINMNKVHSKSKIGIIALYILMICLGLVLGNFIYGTLNRPKNLIAKNRESIASTLPIQKPEIKEKAENVPEKKATPPKEVRVLPATNQTRVKNSFVLNGIFFSENQGFALINNQIVKIGDTVDDALITLITADEVELNSAGSIIKLNRSR